MRLKKLPRTKLGLMYLITQLSMIDMKVEDSVPADVLAGVRLLNDDDVFGDDQDFTPVFWTKAAAGGGTVAQPRATQNLAPRFAAELAAGLVQGASHDSEEGEGGAV